MHTTLVSAERQSQTVVVVNGTIDVVGMLEAVLDGGRYDMVFVDAADNAYTQIRRSNPYLIILCTRMDALDSFQLLTMLKLDPVTRDIPVLTYTTEHEGQNVEQEQMPEFDTPVLPHQGPSMRMN